LLRFIVNVYADLIAAAGDAISGVGRMHGLLGRHRDALAAQAKALSFFLQVLPKNHPRIGYQFLQVANAHAEAGEFQQAIKNTVEALRMYESASLPSTHPQVQMALGLEQLYKRRLHE
jgi:tetratricopeptide (TPR) repeat protein